MYVVVILIGLFIACSCKNGLVIKNYDSTSVDNDLVILPKPWREDKVGDYFSCKIFLSCE